MSEGTTCTRLQVGDRGQRYEVRFTDEDGKDRCAGWTERADGGALVEMVKAHPVWNSPRVIDRHTAKTLPPDHYP